MATSSITHNFVISGKEQVEMFAKAIEGSYQESLTKKPNPDLQITYLEDPEDVKKFMSRWKEKYAR